MATVGARSVHDNLIKSVKSHNCEVVTRLNKIWVDFNLLDGSWLHCVLHSLAHEVNVRLLLVLWSVRSYDRNLRVVTKTSYEALGKVPKRLNFAKDVLAERKHIDAVIVDISLGVGGWHVEMQGMSAFAEE